MNLHGPAVLTYVIQSCTEEGFGEFHEIFSVNVIFQPDG